MRKRERGGGEGARRLGEIKGETEHTQKSALLVQLEFEVSQIKRIAVFLLENCLWNLQQRHSNDIHGKVVFISLIANFERKVTFNLTINVTERLPLAKSDK